MGKNIFALGALLAALGVIIGAFGAHGLESKIRPDQIGTFETGVQYHFYHAFGILMAGILLYRQNNRFLRLGAYMMALGILLFSGSLYLLACRDWLEISHWKWLGPITPIGGLCFIIGWGLLAFAVLRNSRSSSSKSSAT